MVMGMREWGMLLALSVLWGGSFFFVGIAVGALPPLTIVTLRVGLAAATLLVLLRMLGQRLPHGRAVWTALLGMGLLNNAIPFTLIVWGQAQIASGPAAILNATTPLFTVLVAHFCTADEKAGRRHVAGLLLGLAGVAWMVGPSALEGLGGSLPALAVLGGALSYAFAGVYGRRFRRLGVPPMATAAGQVTASTLMLAPFVLLLEHPWTLPAPGFPVWAAIVGLAVLSTALAYVLYFRILASAGATNLLLVTFLIPVSAILLGVLVLGESLEARHFAGMALIGLGLAAIDGRPLRAALSRRRRAGGPAPRACRYR